MTIHRQTFVIGVATILFGLGAAHSHAQAPPEEEAKAQLEIPSDVPADEPADAPRARSARSTFRVG